MKEQITRIHRLSSNQVANSWWCRLSVVLIISISLPTLSFAQNIIWDKTIGGDKNDWLTSLQQTNDGGYILGGYSLDDRSGDKSEARRDPENSIFKGDYWIVKLNADGSKAWDKTFGGNSFDALHSLQQTQDGGYILGGWSYSGISGEKSETNKGKPDQNGNPTSDYWIVKLDASGNKVWDKTIGGNDRDELKVIRQTNDGGYILGGYSTSGISGDKSEAAKGEDEYGQPTFDYWVVKIGADGTKEWDKTIGGKEDDYLDALEQTKNGDYILGGRAYSGISGNKSQASQGESDYWVVKLKADGSQAWDKTFGGTSYDNLTALQLTSDGGYILGGYSYSGKGADKSEPNKGPIDDEGYSTPDYWLVKLKADGTKEWDKTIGGSAEEQLSSLQQTKDGGFILAGSSSSGSSGDKTEANRDRIEPEFNGDYWLVKLKADGTKVWDKTLGGNEKDTLPFVIQTQDGSFIVGGSSYSSVSGEKSEASRNRSYDFWVLKLDNSGTNLIQTITFPNISNKVLGHAPFALSATVDTGQPISFKVVSGPATIKGNIVTLTGVGTVTVKAVAAGNAIYQPATATQTFQVTKIPLVQKQWDKSLGSQGYESQPLILATPDGSYLVAGSSTSGIGNDRSQDNRGGSDYWVVKTDNSGKKLWDKRYGGNNDDFLRAVVATPDGGYLLGGWTYSGIGGDKTQASRGERDFWVVKITADGTKQWDKTFGGREDDEIAALALTADGGYLVGGSSISGINGDKSEANRNEGSYSYDYWVVKLDKAGAKIWDKTFGGAGSAEEGQYGGDVLTDIVSSQDGGYLLGGYSQSIIGAEKSQEKKGGTDFWVIKIDETGKKIWDKVYGGTEKGNSDSPVGDYLKDIVTTQDGGYLLGGNSNSGQSGDKSEANKGKSDFWLVRIDKNGSKIWDKTLGGNGVDAFSSLVVAADGGFLLGGFSGTDSNGDKSEPHQGNYDYWVVRTDKSGNKVWDKTFGTSNQDLLTSIITTPDGYLLSGYSSGSDGDKTESNQGTYTYDYWLVKIEENTPGISAWNMRYGGSGTDNLTDVIKTSDGGYLAGGYSASGNSGDRTQSSRGRNDYWIVKSDKNGRKLWEKRYGGTDNDYLNRVIQTQDGGYLLGGSSLSGVGGDKSQASQGERDYWVIKVDAAGNKQWDKTLGGKGYDELRKVVQLATGEYVLGGYSSSPQSGNKSQGTQGSLDYWLVKLSAGGDKIWDKRYGGAANETLGSFTQTQDGGYLLAGSSYSGVSGDKTQSAQGSSDYWVVRTDKDGNLLWDKTFGGHNSDELTSVGRIGSDFFLAGSSSSGADGDKSQANRNGTTDYWLVKINANGTKIWDKTFGGNASDILYASTYTKEGNIVLAGTSYSGAGGDKTQSNQGHGDYWVVQVDKDGNKVHDQRFGGNGREELRTVTQTRDGGLLLGGRSDSGVSGDRTQPSQGGTDYWLVKLAPLKTTTVAAREASIVEAAIAQVEELQVLAYPNPFSERATIRFTLPETQQATVKVYDGQGNEVATLFNGEAKAKQNYQVEWEAANKPAGLYFLQLQTPTKKHQQKLLLTK